MNKEFKIKEAMKTEYGKLKYVIELTQGEKNKIQMYINNSNTIHFDSNSYIFSNYAIFDVTQEAHVIAKEIFLTYLQAHVKTQLLELKQLELVLDMLGLKNIIRKTIVDNSSMLLETKEDIIQASIENTTKLIEENIENTKKIAEEKAIKVIDETIRPIAKKKRERK